MRPTGIAHRHCGLTLTEVTVSIAVIAIFLASLHAMNSQLTLLIRSSRNQSAASRLLQERAEQLRIAGWSNVTSPTALDRLMREPTQTERSGSFGEQAAMLETITVTELDPATLIERNANIVIRRKVGQTTTSSSGRLAHADLVRVDFDLAWSETERPVVPRRITVTLSRGGMVGGGGANSSETADPASSGTDTPRFCKHGRPWPHCGERAAPSALPP